jgi:spore germination protein KA
MAMAVLVIVTHMAGLRSFGVPYLSPVAPASYRDWKDVIVRAPWWSMFMRPAVIGRRESIRQDYRLKPVPPHRDAPGEGGD